MLHFVQANHGGKITDLREHDCFEIPTIDDWIDDRETEASSMNMTLSANALASNGELAKSLL